MRLSKKKFRAWPIVRLLLQQSGKIFETTSSIIVKDFVSFTWFWRGVLNEIGA
jgi:hypothetical protein